MFNENELWHLHYALTQPLIWPTKFALNWTLKGVSGGAKAGWSLKFKPKWFILCDNYIFRMLLKNCRYLDCCHLMRYFIQNKIFWIKTNFRFLEIWYSGLLLFVATKRKLFKMGIPLIKLHYLYLSFFLSISFFFYKFFYHPLILSLLFISFSFFSPSLFLFLCFSHFFVSFLSFIHSFFFFSFSF